MWIWQHLITRLVPECKCSAVPGELSSKFTISEEPYRVGYVMKTSRRISLQNVQYGKSFFGWKKKS